MMWDDAKRTEYADGIGIIYVNDRTKGVTKGGEYLGNEIWDSERKVRCLRLHDGTMHYYNYDKLKELTGICWE